MMALGVSPSLPGAFLKAKELATRRIASAGNTSRKASLADGYISKIVAFLVILS